MIELFPNVYHVPGRNGSRFPYCSCLYLRGGDLRVLIDAGMGAANLNACLDQGIDVLILSHCHIDHRLTRREIPDIPVWCHEQEAPYVQNRQAFMDGAGFSRGGYTVEQVVGPVRAFEAKVARRLSEGESFDFGRLKVRLLHTPGHTPGHLSFHFPELDFLFAADVDLMPFGPYYGNDFADIDDFIESIGRLSAIHARTVLTGHAGPFNENLESRYRAYEQVIYQRDELLVDLLDKPRSLDELCGRNLIFNRYPRGDQMSEWTERVMLEKHLDRLTALERVRRVDGLWLRN